MGEKSGHFFTFTLLILLQAGLGAKAITIGELCLSGRTGINQDLLLSPNHKLLLQEKISENSVLYNGKMRIKSSNKVKTGLLRHKMRPMSNAVIRPNGDIRIDSMAPFVIGNILEDDFSTVWSKKAKKCWEDPNVLSYIDGFDDNDRNYASINYCVDEYYF